MLCVFYFHIIICVNKTFIMYVNKVVKVKKEAIDIEEKKSLFLQKLSVLARFFNIQMQLMFNLSFHGY
ncbi:hypothetical protein EG347_10380 [Chryseobacterium sp. G0186]|nr:hypothetical protein EG347_10380 [Chryseobacterium sp. G0186]